MKTLPRRLFLLASLLALGGVSSIVCGAETVPPAEAPAAVATGQVKQPTKLINIDFPGGTVAQLVAVMAKSDSGPFNVVAEKEEMEVLLPPLSLRNVEPNALGQTLQALLEHRYLNFLPISTGTYVLSKNENLRRFHLAEQTQRVVFESFQLTPYLADQSIDDIVGAIRAGWELDPAHDRSALRIKFHSATSLLLISGPSDAIMLTHGILGQMKHGSEKTTPAKPVSPLPPSEEKK